ncbi:MAG: succinate dehydrogenase, hydrophobic membrane anchor protein [Sphingomicrobium sp.]|nr:succinate dehydrogenase, hydrophobic membrane anchor protein [Sphingomonadales bacterium]
MSLGESATSLGKVRGLGSAGVGGEHWIKERMTSAALIGLSIWFLASILWLPSLDQKTIGEWLRAPTGAVPMALFIILNFIHAVEGTKSWIYDYFHDDGNRFAAHLILVFAAVLGSAFALFALAKIAFGTHP